MKDKLFLELIEKVKEELYKRYGRNKCKELHYDCSSCKANILISLLNSEIDLLEWIIKKDNKK